MAQTARAVPELRDTERPGVDLVWVVAVAALALVVGAGGGALLTAVLIAAGRGQREGDAPCPRCSSSGPAPTGATRPRAALGDGDRRPHNDRPASLSGPHNEREVNAGEP